MTDRSEAAVWDQRYRSGCDGWELGRPAPPLEHWLRQAPSRPHPPGLVMVPGCGRGHEARLLAELGFSVVGVDSSGEALRQARELHGTQLPGLRWLQADLFDAEALAAGGLGPGSLAGVLEHTSFCAIDPSRRQDWIDTMTRLLAPEGWLLGLFWCHGQSGGPPWGTDPAALAARLAQAGLACDFFQPARGSATSRDGTLREGEWLGQWHRASAPVPLEELPAASLTPPVVLTIGGSDSGGGAGIQADLKTFAALQVHGCSALTCVTAQNTLGVDRVDGLPAAALAAQIQAVCRDLPVRALKTGMLLNQDLITTTAEQIAPLEAFRLIDPVMVSRAGAVLLEPDAIAAMQQRLLPLADLLTPNIREASLLSGLPITSAAEMEAAAEALAAQGPKAVLLKGGGLAALRGVDLFWCDGHAQWLRSAAVATPHTHGSGCTLSAAIVAQWARGLPLLEAIHAAKGYVEGGLRSSLAIGGGQGPLGHWHRSLQR